MLLIRTNGDELYGGQGCERELPWAEGFSESKFD